MLPLVRHTARATACAVALAVLAACGSTPEAGSGPGTGPASGAASTTGSGTGSQTPSGSQGSSTAPSASGSPAEGSPGVPAATGIPLDNQTFTLRAPAGWSRDRVAQLSFNSRAAQSPDHQGELTTYSACVTLGGTHPSLAWLSKQDVAKNPGTRRVDDVRVGGQAWYHITGPGSLGWFDSYGSVVGDCTSIVAFSLGHSFTPASRRAVIDAVLASYRLD